MLKYIRIVLIVLFCLALVGAAGLYYYNYTHEDTSPPAFRSGSDLLEISVKDPSEALLANLEAYDNVDGNLTDKIRVKDISTLISDKDVNVTYIVFDAASNYATYTRTVRYTDYAPPRFSMLRPMIFNVGETLNFGGSIRVTDLRDGDISGRLKLEESTVINNTPGTYSVTLSATNRMGDSIQLPLTVQVIDSSVTRPKIVLTDYLVYAQVGDTLNYRRYIDAISDPLSDNPETVISVYKVTINSTRVNMSVPGVYEVYYYYTGISGEIATVILTVIVE